MIKFTLACDQGHEFESWFPDGAAYEEQSKRGFVACPVCGATRVSKAPMAPAVVTRGAGLRDEKAQALREMMIAMRREIEKRTDDVGEAFPQVARAIHAGDAPERAIRGKANLAEVKALLEDGVGVLPVPRLPDEAN
jgi:hypothetical protein